MKFMPRSVSIAFVSTANPEILLKVSVCNVSVLRYIRALENCVYTEWEDYCSLWNCHHLEILIYIYFVLLLVYIYTYIYFFKVYCSYDITRQEREAFLPSADLRHWEIHAHRLYPNSWPGLPAVWFGFQETTVSEKAVLGPFFRFLWMFLLYWLSIFLWVAWNIWNFIPNQKMGYQAASCVYIWRWAGELRIALPSSYKQWTEWFCSQTVLYSLYSLAPNVSLNLWLHHSLSAVLGALSSFCSAGFLAIVGFWIHCADFELLYAPPQTTSQKIIFIGDDALHQCLPLCSKQLLRKFMQH